MALNGHVKWSNWLLFRCTFNSNDGNFRLHFRSKREKMFSTFRATASSTGASEIERVAKYAERRAYVVVAIMRKRHYPFDRR